MLFMSVLLEAVLDANGQHQLSALHALARCLLAEAIKRLDDLGEINQGSLPPASAMNTAKKCKRAEFAKGPPEMPSCRLPLGGF